MNCGSEPTIIFLINDKYRNNMDKIYEWKEVTKIQKSCEFQNEPTQIDKYTHTEQQQENSDNVI